MNFRKIVTTIVPIISDADIAAQVNDFVAELHLDAARKLAADEGARMKPDDQLATANTT